MYRVRTVLLSVVDHYDVSTPGPSQTFLADKLAGLLLKKTYLIDRYKWRSQLKNSGVFLRDESPSRHLRGNQSRIRSLRPPRWYIFRLKHNYRHCLPFSCLNEKRESTIHYNGYTPLGTVLK